MLCVEAHLLEASAEDLGQETPTGDKFVCAVMRFWPHRSSLVLQGSYLVLPVQSLAVPFPPLIAPASRLKCQSALAFFNLLVLADVGPNRSISIDIITIRRCDVTLLIQCFSFILFFW